MVTFLICIAVGLVILIVFSAGDANGYSRGIKIKDSEIKTAVQMGYDRGVKDSEQYVSDSMKKGMDLIEAELNKKGFTLRDNSKPETEKDKKIAEALTQQRKKLEVVQSTPNIHKPKSPLKLVKDPPKLTIIKNEDKQ